jgi:hypothetical protein
MPIEIAYHDGQEREHVGLYNFGQEDEWEWDRKRREAKELNWY